MKKLTLTTLIFLLAGSICAQNTTTWGKTEHKGKPWVENTSRPNKITNGLQGRHFSIWASHGRYFDNAKCIWKWQRPILFGTTEDLFTPTIVVPYLMPMLENAGAIVFSPRERDWQANEVIVDNDTPLSSYAENNAKKKWKSTEEPGFAFHKGTYADGENPFTAGTSRQIKTRKKDTKLSSIVYKPNFPEEGRYAVYVSYQTMKKSTEAAQYIVRHKGSQTIFRVNQKMGGGTWVYLGTFDFDKGQNQRNCVILTNHSTKKGIVTADAVRFGGGMGNIQRGSQTSQLPRALEGARYYAQWAGAPREIVSKSGGSNDYTDDINVRSLMTNWLAGGSCYLPDHQGKNVPIELTLAIHSDAGVKADGSVVGTLGICTTQQGEPTLDTRLSRQASRILAEELVQGVKKDIEATFGVNWNTRSVRDQNYSETRLPAQPSAILEVLSHQNFPDMRLAQDPNFRFILARSIYKTILRYTAAMHGTTSIVQPLAPRNFSVEIIAPGKVRLSWDPTPDATEPSATPTSYNVYIAAGKAGFNNGQNITTTNLEIPITPGISYSFRITACNAGGESFPTETLAACSQPGATETILVVNGFDRLSSPAIINTNIEQGFDIETDPGITLGPTLGWSGRQSNFDKQQMGKEGQGSLGYGGEELTGTLVAGNNLNYVPVHVEAIQTLQKYNIASTSGKTIEAGKINLKKYALIDLALGLEKDDGHSLYLYKTIAPETRRQLTEYLSQGGKLLISGAYLATDMKTPEEEQWLAQTLKIKAAGINADNNSPQITGLGMQFNIHRTINSEHYGAYNPNIIQPADTLATNINPIMTYADGSTAALAWNNAPQAAIILAFPWECITSPQQRNRIMRGLITHLMK